MSRTYKIGLVLGGYAAAALLSLAAFYVVTQIRMVEGLSGGGMQAFGDVILVLGLFGVLSVVPTALALYFLRPLEKFWTVFALASLALAATGPIAALMMGRPSVPWVPLFVGFFGLLKVLGAPLFCFAFLLCAFISPTRRPRRMLLAAAGIEFVVGAYGFFCLLVLGHWAL